MSLAPGTRLGPYEILSPLGAGGMGEVYRARDTRLGRVVAIKVLPEDVAGDAGALSRFGSEARALASLSHPNILSIFDVGEAAGVHYAVSELLEGRTLRDLMRDERLAPRQAVDFGIQIANGLATAHEHGIVHRDVKPENVFVTAEGHVKILDFGLAKEVQRGERGAEFTSAPTRTAGTEAGVVLGTVGYMSPEQARGEPLDLRSDVFSLGAVLYEMLSGRRAFKGGSAADTLSAILTAEPPALTDVDPEISPALGRVVRRCLEKSPSRRFQSARDVAFALEEASGAAAGPVPPHALKIAAGAALALALVAAAVIGVGRTHGLFTGGDAASRIESIVVLPLANFSGDPEQDYFADGVTEELITDLSQIASLRVISRTSAMAYRGTRKRVPEIGRELGVDAVIEGSVQRSGGRVRITAQLVRAATDQHLWARSYERDLKDVLALQSEVAAAVAAEVRAALTPEEKVRLGQARPVDPEAHELYLKGRFRWNKGTGADLLKAVSYFEGALTRDPAYAPAYAGLADSYVQLSDFHRPPYEVMPKAKVAASRALALDDTLADAHVSLANVLFLYDRDWAAGEREARRALELKPNTAGAHDLLGAYYGAVGRSAESAAEFDRALTLDPLSAPFRADAGWARVMARDYDKAIELFRKTLEIEPDFGFPYEGIAIAEVQRRRCADAIPVAEKGAKVEDSPLALAMSGGIYAACGESGRARGVLKKLATDYRERYVCPYEIAVIQIGLGEKDSAFRSLEKGIEDRSICVPFLKNDPRMDPVRSDPRYVELVRRLAFP